ncbi:MAG: hypothetical protein V3W41_21405 [Planctomycetota bacterium]
MFRILTTSVLIALTTLSLGAQRRGPSAEPSRAGKGSKIFIVRPSAAFEGRIIKRLKSKIIVETALGRREIERGALIEDKDAAALLDRYAKRLQKLDRRDLKARRVLALWCERVGLTSGLAEQLEAILKRAPNDAKAWSTLKRLSPAFRPAARNVVPAEKNRWSRKEVDLLMAGLRRTSRVRAAILCERLRGLPEEVITNPLLKAAAKGSRNERLVASRLLGNLKTTRRVKPLYRRALADPVWSVREAAVQSLKRRDDGSTIGPFLKVLLQAPRAQHRLYAAEALGQLGDRRAVPALLRALRAAGDNPVARSNLTFTRQIAYIKDFDVEVAQGAVIADPIVGIVQEGVVLDVALVAITVQRRTIGAALGRLTGQNFGGDHRKWSAWWAKNKATFA